MFASLRSRLLLALALVVFPAAPLEVQEEDAAAGVETELVAASRHDHAHKPPPAVDLQTISAPAYHLVQHVAPAPAPVRQRLHRTPPPDDGQLLA